MFQHIPTLNLQIYWSNTWQIYLYIYKRNYANKYEKGLAKDFDIAVSSARYRLRVN